MRREGQSLLHHLHPGVRHEQVFPEKLRGNSSSPESFVWNAARGREGRETVGGWSPYINTFYFNASPTDVPLRVLEGEQPALDCVPRCTPQIRTQKAASSRPKTR
ncbi:hypothetical protein E2C01_047048 [Portunus trituberculatus]|uniref:Uncharacterized protein n=1 Tax=Portunus trituberculatus TaxID=210409 RepID=A0A5B7G2K9_PORTR|nr:hypothetical protein [Portunus trituberculatus]